MMGTGSTTGVMLLAEFKTTDITYAGHTVQLPDDPIYAKFYTKLRAGRWEPETFRVLRRNLNKQTIYVDIGAWIGVTPLWASFVAKSVIAVEPDPKCHAFLSQLARQYANVKVIHRALSNRDHVSIRAVGEFGNSASTVLDISDGESVRVKGYGMTDILKEVGRQPLFMKIDIEGYEFDMASEIEQLKSYEVCGLQIAVHPQIFERNLRGNWLNKRWKTYLETRKLARVLKQQLPNLRIEGHFSLLSYTVFGVLLRPKPIGTDFVFEKAIPVLP